MVQSAASTVGLGGVVGELNGEVDQFFKDVSKMSPDDLHPENIKRKKEEIKQKIIEKTKSVLISKFREFGISEDLGNNFFNLIMSQDKSVAAASFSHEIEKSSGGKLPAGLLQWILGVILNQK